VVRGQTLVNVEANDSLTGISKVDIYVDGALKGTLSEGPYEYLWNSAGVGDGSHVIDARAYDGAGNQSSASVNVFVDNTSSVNTVEIQPDGLTGKDSYIYQGSATGNYGNKTTLRAGGEMDKIYHGLLQYDLSGIPAGATITNARLKLYMSGASGEPLNISVHRVTSEWDESAASWKNRKDGVPWESAGGDFRELAENTSIAIAAEGGWYNWDATSLVQDWVRGGVPNYGMLLKGNNESTYDHYHRSFYTSDYTSKVYYRPVLEVSYIFKPLNNAVVWGQTPIYIEAADSLSGIERIELYVDGSMKATLTEGPYEYTWDTASVSDGSHTIQAKIYDNAGNEGVSTATVTVDNSSGGNPVEPSKVSLGF
jgi:hypothetical protein